ncbi:MAG: hypothetical protein V5A58_03700 [Salinibacter sp.]|uniref:hypothetical protein n=1 Tax=Salinibacter sp. TaxID=2065818 RepID=UPI002FC39DEE
MRRVLFAYLALGLLLAPMPLLNVLQAESAAVVALAAYFISGGAAVRAFGTTSRSVWWVMARQEAALLVPLGVLLLAQLWAPSCPLGQGLLFYVLFPGVTVVFAVALAYLLQGLPVARPGWILCGLGLLLAVGGPLYDLGLHPQFYTYNHVFGGVLGPIYDEQLAVRPGLFAFRGLTLLWALLALLVGHRLRGRGPRWAPPACALVLGTGYVFAGPLGINTTAASLQDHLGGHTRTTHFDLYYDSTQVDAAAAADLAAAHEAKYDWVRRQLNLEPDAKGPRIQSYIYPTPDVKGRLTGARTTSVSPVWLDAPQVHLLRDRVSQSLGHELAHVVSRPYGLPGLRASWAPGLVEGWAVALEPPSPGPSPDDLVRTAAQSDTTTTLTTEAEAVAQRLTPWGFWTGRGAVSYATMGSFVRYLLDRHGPAQLKRVYAWGDFEAVYGQSLSTLAAGWASHLRRAPAVSRGAHDVVARRFTRPSLFETACPHHVPPARRHYQTAQRAAQRRDTTEMVRFLRKALRAQPHYAAAHEALARHRLAQRRPNAVWRQVDTLSRTARTVPLQVAQADAAVLRGEPDTARALYAGARAQTPGHAHDLQARLALRDAIAARPSIIRVLTSGAAPATQARRLAGMSPRGTRVRAWEAVRWMDASQYHRALALWRRLEGPVRIDRPRGWHRAWELQHAAWGTKAALRENSGAVARRWATRAERRARVLGDDERASLFEWWKRRALDAGVEPQAAQRRSPSANHVSRLLVEAHARFDGSSRCETDPVSIPNGPRGW